MSENSVEISKIYFQNRTASSNPVRSANRAKLKVSFKFED